ncbi:Drug/metabolite transporter (DMT) permease superfamily protein [Candidatus Filomicrobium marinum]|uniref:Drug/metabolite transporter (DMT) permease superfamily protein n=2 Tax=Filomicrobium TaxID=119044 RepID=A0A0D6JJE1_9HYPH|nr:MULTISPECIES: DMT family transporter [Filomicrobium]CFX30519.1 Drug/metabolite transporter (DMT) permease superfamily protein [Candidatus Filomicrobium marinum]CPR22078.1 Drug/metabolite transporter (DMT) permease superfamily protein [Candidatus Filomicrobium marinum]SDP44286.1 Permease of the drug/metabolite transporter (DMT) superfamily [Filomicrobium insigne]
MIEFSAEFSRCELPHGCLSVRRIFERASDLTLGAQIHHAPPPILWLIAMSYPEPAGPPARKFYDVVKFAISRVWHSPYILLALAVLFWSGNFIVGRATTGIVPPIALAFWRWTLGLILVVAVGAPQIRRDWPMLKKHWPILLLLGGFGIAAFNTLVYVGLQTTTAVNALLLQSAMPVIILAAVFLLYGERASVRQALGVLISICGVAVIAARGDWGALAALSLNSGDVWVLAAVAAYAMYSALLRKRPAVHPLSFLAATFAIGAAMLLPLYVYEHLTVARVEPVWAASLAVAYVAVFPGFLSYLFFNRGVELAGANMAGHFVHLMPIFGSGLAILLLGERFASFHLVGATLIGIGLGLATIRRS